VAKVSQNRIVETLSVPVAYRCVLSGLQFTVPVQSVVPVLLLGPKEHAVSQPSFAKLSVRSMTLRRSASSIQAIVECFPPTQITETDPYSG
jgi:hypothetical protein